MPLVSIDSASAVSASGSNLVRGWPGLGLIRSTGRSRRSPASPELELSGRIAERPRPMPLLVPLATGDELLRQRPVGDGAARRGGVLGHGETIARGLGDADAARDHRREDHPVEVIAQLGLDVLSQPGALVV